MAAKKGVDLSKLMSMLECSICLERYENPKMLKCTHEFCKPCLEGILEFRADGSATIVCPLRCKAQTVIGKQETVNDLAASYIAKNVLEAVSTEGEEPHAQQFPICNANADCTKCVAMFCCEHLLCNSCYKKHAVAPVHKRTFRLDHDARKNALVVTCEKHVSKCTHVCEDGKFMCVYCLHRDPTHRNLCSHANNNIDGVVSSLRQTLEKEVKRHDKMEQSKTLTLSDVDIVRRVYGEKIRARKEELLKEYSDFLDEKEETTLRNIETYCKSLISENFGIEDNREVYTCKNVLDRGIDVELLVRRKELQDAVKDQNDKRTLRTLHLSLSESLGMLNPDGPLGLVNVENREISQNNTAVSTLSFDPAVAIEDSPPVLSHLGMLDESCSAGAGAVLDPPKDSGLKAKSIADPTAEPKEFDMKGKSHAACCSSNSKRSNSASSNEVPPPPVDCHVLKTEGNKHFQERRYTEALECYSRAICHADSNESLAIFYQNRAAANEKLQRWNDVIGDCSAALKADPKYCKALLRRARAYQSSGKKRMAAEDFTRLYSTRGCTLQGCTHMNPNNNDSTSYQKLMIQSIRSIGTGLADAVWTKRPMTFPADALVRTYFENTSNFDIFDNYDTLDRNRNEDRLYAKILERKVQCDFKEVYERCSALIDIQSKHWERASLLRGSLRYLMEDPENAHEDFSRVFGLTQTDANIPLIIDAALRLADVTNEMYFIDEAMKLDRRNAKIFCRKGRLLTRMQNQSGSKPSTGFAEACTSLKLAIALDPGYIAPRLSLAECLYYFGDNPEEANSVMEETIRLFPNSSLAFCIYGNLLRMQHTPGGTACDIHEANVKLSMAIALDPSDPRPYEYKVQLMGAADFVDDVKSAIKLKSSWALQAMVLVQLEQGKIDAALNYLKKVTEVNATKPELINAFCLLEDISLQSKFGYLRSKTKKQYHNEMNTHSVFLSEMIERVMCK